jgi:YfiH family protein
MEPLYHNGLPYLRFSTFPANGRLRHAVFTRQGGVSPAPFESLNLSVSVADDKENVYANRRRAFGLYGRNTHNVVHAHLVHGNEVARVTQANNGSWVGPVDALITDEPGCAMTMNFGDCAPILLYDPQQHAVGLGHAGWKGAMVDLPGAMVRAMQREFGSRPESLLAAVGPCIGPCCYEVGEAVISAAHKAFDDPQTLLHARQEFEGPTFDLPEANRRNLQRAGVRQIEMSGLCTACRTDLFFSHRAEKGRTGRFGAIVLL